MPCLNEAESLGQCIGKAQDGLERAGVERRGRHRRQRQHRRLAGDRPRARRPRRRRRPRRATAPPCRAASRPPAARYVIMGDADDSLRLQPPRRLRRAAARRRRPGHGQPLPRRHPAGRDALPAPLPRQPGADRHRPTSSSAAPIGDFHCGLRGFRTDAYATLDLHDARAWSSPARWSSRRRCNELKISEVPTTLSPDGRDPPAAPAQLARRLAAPALPAALQPALALLLPRPGADGARPGRDDRPAAGRTARSSAPASTSTRWSTRAR